MFTTLLLAVLACCTSPSECKALSIVEDGPVNMDCLNNNCASGYQTCLIHTKCRLLLDCLTKCYSGFDDDTSPYKTTTQHCIYTCQFTYADEFYVGLSRCLTDNSCFELPPIKDACKYPSEVVVSKQYQLRDLKGGWWVVKGYNPAQDCWPCQHTFFDAEEYDNKTFHYRPSFEVANNNGSFDLINGTIYVTLKDTAPGEAINISYYLYGMPVNLTWYTLDGKDDNSTVLVYYCGNMLQWNFEGAVFLSRSPVIPPSSDAWFEEMLEKNTHLKYSDFCSPQLYPCPN